MKFTDGYWQLRPGVTLHGLLGVRDWRIDASELIVYVGPRPIAARGDDLNQPLLEVRLSSPAPEVIRVRLAHHLGGCDRGPRFALAAVPDHVPVIDETEDALRLTSGSLTAVVGTRTWQIEFQQDGRLLTRSAPRAAAYLQTADGAFWREQLSLSVGENVYGLGERFTPFVKNGQVVEIWNRDGGTASEQAYKNIPFYLTNRGYGVLVNHPEQVSFEVGSEHVERVQFSVPGEYLEYLVIGGPTMADALERYTALTGRPALPPAWSLGLWLSTSFTTEYDEATITHFIEGMAARTIPLSVFHFDCFWMRGYHWSDFDWDLQAFPDPPAMLARLKARGLRICVWINPYIAQRSRLFAEGMAEGYLLRTPEGDVWQTDLWQPGMGIVDFTNSAACAWYAGHLQRLLAMGVDCFKTDFGERIPTEVVYHDGSDPLKMHNYYTYLYNQLVFGVLEQVRGVGDAVVFARSATVGSQRFPAHWGGDNSAAYESMAETLRGGLSLALSGFAFWSHDIGGFEETASADVYKRWIAFGLLSSHSRLHGSHSYRVPWLFDEEAVEVMRFFSRLKCRLMRYLYARACEAHTRGLPVLRPMVLAFPGDPACEGLDRQYMLGDALLVAPVFRADGVAQFYLPRGTWTNFFTLEQVQGGVWREEQHGYRSVPLYARESSIVPLGSRDDRADYDLAEGVVLHLFAFGEGAHAVCTVHSTAGLPELQVGARRAGAQIVLTVIEQRTSWTAVLHGVPGVAGVTGGTAEPLAEGVRVVPDRGATAITIALGAPA